MKNNNLLQFIFTSLICLNALAENSIELEHSISVQNGGGSSWGTDGLLKSQIKNIEDHLIPTFFNQKKNSFSKSSWIELENPLAKKYFRNSRIFLLSELNICFDESINFQTNSFLKAVKEFESQLFFSQNKSNSSRFKLSKFSSIQQSEKCDVLVIKGQKDVFPYSIISKYEKPNDLFPQIVLGLYYQKTLNHKPVIVFHPNVEIDFSGQSNSYLRLPISHSKLQVDGRVLFLHELGHVLGLTHVHATNSKSLYIKSLMGLDNDNRHPDEIRSRFYSRESMWQNLDLIQSKIYRAIDYLYINNLNSNGGIENLTREIQTLNFNESCLLTGETIQQELPLPHFIESTSTIKEMLNKLLPFHNLYELTLSGNMFKQYNLNTNFYLKLKSSVIGKKNSNPSLQVLSFEYKQTKFLINELQAYSDLQASLKIKTLETGAISHQGVFKLNNQLLGFWGPYSYKIVKDLKKCFENKTQ